jgi:hypothetical protein
MYTSKKTTPEFIPKDDILFGLDVVASASGDRDHHQSALRFSFASAPKSVASSVADDSSSTSRPFSSWLEQFVISVTLDPELPELIDSISLYYQLKAKSPSFERQLNEAFVTCAPNHLTTIFLALSYD